MDCDDCWSGMDSFDIFKKLSAGAKFKKPDKSAVKIEVICL